MIATKRARILISACAAVVILSVVNIWVGVASPWASVVAFFAACLTAMTQRCKKCGVPYIFQFGFSPFKKIPICPYCSHDPYK